MRAGTLIVIGVFAVVVGLVPPISILCVASGAVCVYLGYRQLKEEAKEEVQPEDGDNDE